MGSNLRHDGAIKGKHTLLCDHSTTCHAAVQAYIAGPEYKGPQSQPCSSSREHHHASQAGASSRVTPETPFSQEAHKDFACKVACFLTCASGAGLSVSWLIGVIIRRNLFTDQQLHSSKTCHSPPAVQGVAVQAVTHGGDLMTVM